MFNPVLKGEAQRFWFHIMHTKYEARYLLNLYLFKL